MATTNRAYGMRGAAIALGITAIAAATQGVLTAVTGVIALEILCAVVMAIALVIAGATSARQTWPGAAALAVFMGVLFFWLRWTLWSFMSGGAEAALAFALTPPWLWYPAMDTLSATGAITGNTLWIMEGATMLAAAATGCLLGYEPKE